VACKRYHDLGPDDDDIKATLGSTLVHNSKWTSPKDRDADTWLLIDFQEMTDANGEFKWRFVRTGCRHCEQPGCIEACPKDAITKDATTGAVTTDAGLCIGCKSCTEGQGLEGYIDLGCPFDIPRYGVKTVGTEDKTVMAKCAMCKDRLDKNLEPACAQTCPVGAITFGDKATMLSNAKATDLNVYGESLNDDAALDPGISVYYASDEDFSKYDAAIFPTTAEFKTKKEEDDGEDGFPTWGYAAIAAGAVAVVAIGGYALYKRKEAVAEEEDDDDDDDDDKKKKKGGKKKKD
jgi:formate dehydrogenase iron-sulfur subunit